MEFAAMAAGHRPQDAGLTINTDMSRVGWEEVHSAPGGSNTHWGSSKQNFPLAPRNPQAIPGASTPVPRRRGCRAGRAVKARNAARAQDQSETEVMMASENRHPGKLVYTREQLEEIQENTATLAPYRHSHEGQLVKVDSVGEIKNLGTGHDGRMLLSISTLTPDEMHYISSTNQGPSLPLSELHLAMHRAQQERSEDDHDLFTVQKATRTRPRGISLAPEFLSPDAGHRHQMVKQGRADRQEIRPSYAIVAIGAERAAKKAAAKNPPERSPRRTPDERFESLLARLRPLAGSSTNSSSAGSEYGIINGIYPPREKKDKGKDKARTFNPNATEFVPVQQDASASVGVGFIAKPPTFVRKAVNGLFSPEITPAIPGAPVIPPAQLKSSTPAVPINMIDPAIISYSPAPAPIAPGMILGMPPPLTPNGLGSGLPGMTSPFDIFNNPFLMGVPNAPIVPPMGLGFINGPNPVVAPILPNPGPTQFPSMPPPPPRPVRKPRIPDSTAQMQYEQYLEERRARDPHGYALECKRRQAARWQRQRFPGQGDDSA